MWDEPECPLSQAYMDDLCRTIVSTTPQAGMIAIPWLLVHGTADDVVLAADTESIVAMGKSNVTAKFVEGAGHSFNDPAHKALVTEAVCGWLAGLAAKE
jgi:alpha-beta hydrolase superfamily lysophospholipase